MRARSARLAIPLLGLVASCGARSELVEAPPAITPGLDGGDATSPADAASGDTAADQAVDQTSPSDVSTDIAVDAGPTWHPGAPVEFAEAVGAPISVARSTDSVLVAYATTAPREARHLVVLGLDGAARGASRVVLESAEGDQSADDPYGPWVAWGAAGGIVAATDAMAGCRALRLDSQGRDIAGPASTGLASCGLLTSISDGWSVITGLSASGRSSDPIGLSRLDATARSGTTPVDLMPDPADNALDNPDRADAPDGSFALSWWDSADRTGPAYVQRYGPNGVPLGPPALVARIGSYAGPASTRLVALGRDTLVGWTIAAPRPSASIQRLDAAATRVGSPSAIGVGDGVVLRLGLLAVRGHVLLAWTERVAVGDVRLRVQARRRDGVAMGEPIEVARMPAIGRPEVVETPAGALLVYVAQFGSEVTGRHLYGLPLTFVP